MRSSLELTSSPPRRASACSAPPTRASHPDSRGWAEDLAHIRAKVDAGVTRPRHAALLRQRRLPPLRRAPARAGGIDVPALLRHHPDHQHRHDRLRGHRCAARRSRPARAPRARVAPGRPARGRRARRGLRDRPGRGAAGEGGARRAPVHAQSVFPPRARSCPRSVRRERRPAATAAGQRPARAAKRLGRLERTSRHGHRGGAQPTCGGIAASSPHARTCRL